MMSAMGNMCAERRGLQVTCGFDLQLRAPDDGWTMLGSVDHLQTSMSQVNSCTVG